MIDVYYQRHDGAYILRLSMSEAEFQTLRESKGWKMMYHWPSTKRSYMVAGTGGRIGGLIPTGENIPAWVTNESLISKRTVERYRRELEAINSPDSAADPTDP